MFFFFYHYYLFLISLYLYLILVVCFFLLLLFFVDNSLPLLLIFSFCVVWFFSFFSSSSSLASSYPPSACLPFFLCLCGVFLGWKIFLRWLNSSSFFSFFFALPIPLPACNVSAEWKVWETMPPGLAVVHRGRWKGEKTCIKHDGTLPSLSLSLSLSLSSWISSFYLEFGSLVH